MMLVALVVAGLVALHTYAAAIAVACLFRDPTLVPAAKVVRVLTVLVVPLVASLLVIRSTAEFSPEALPSRRWVRPLLPLLHANAARSSDTEFDVDNMSDPGHHDHS